MGFYVQEGRVNNSFSSVREEREEWVSIFKRRERTMGLLL